MDRISLATLNAWLSDPTVPESRLRPYLIADPLESQGFRPSIVPNPALVIFPDTEAAVALASLNGVSRWRRQFRYRVKLAGWSGPKVVAEGDSWFQYPFLIEDVVDHLFEPWAIYCCSGAGDLLSDMARQDEVVVAVRAEQPDYVLLSGGGNDLLGDGRLARYLSAYVPDKAAADYLSPTFEDLLSRTIDAYREIVSKVLAAGDARVICHSYDYPVPNGGPWLGRPMLKLGIVDIDLQRHIARLLIDRFHAALSAMAADLGDRVAVADCRGTVRATEWFDELHPTSAAFGRVARIIRAAAEQVDLEAAPLEETVTVPRPLQIGDRESVAALLSRDDEALLAEIGRRSSILEFSPDAAAGMSLEISVGGSEESILPAFKEAGARILDRWQRELYKLLCGDGGAAKDERDKLRSALRLQETALIGAITAALMAIGTPPFIAPLIAAIIVKSGINPAWEEACKIWGEKLGPLA
jgi:lysophospholipase L1-like esterase